MAALTPTASLNLSLGSIDGVGATFATITDGDTWETPMSVVAGAVVMPITSGYTYGIGISGSTITFHTAGGVMTTPRVLVYGYK